MAMMSSYDERMMGQYTGLWSVEWAAVQGAMSTRPMAQKCNSTPSGVSLTTHSVIDAGCILHPQSVIATLYTILTVYSIQIKHDVSTP
jgi:hypothetical protein